MQRVENSAAGFVLCRYSRVKNVIDLKWLPVKERIEFNIAKLTFKAINFDNWPAYLTVKVKQQTRVLRMLEIPRIKILLSILHLSFLITYYKTLEIMIYSVIVLLNK